MKKLFLIASMFLLTACDNEPPKCDAEEVTDVISQILAGKNLKFIQNSSVTTISQNGNVRMCKSRLKYNQSGRVEEEFIQYEINISDNGKEFTVEIY